VKKVNNRKAETQMVAGYDGPPQNDYYRGRTSCAGHSS